MTVETRKSMREHEAQQERGKASSMGGESFSTLSVDEKSKGKYTVKTIRVKLN